MSVLMSSDWATNVATPYATSIQTPITFNGEVTAEGWSADQPIQSFKYNGTAVQVGFGSNVTTCFSFTTNAVPSKAYQDARPLSFTYVQGTVKACGDPVTMSFFFLPTPSGAVNLIGEALAGIPLLNLLPQAVEAVVILLAVVFVSVFAYALAKRK